MDSAAVREDRRDAPAADHPPIPLKILVAGGFGVGKTTFVGSLSEIPPLSTEQEMTTSLSSTCSGRPASNASGSCGTS